MSGPIALKTAPGLRQFLPPPFGPLSGLRRDAVGFLLAKHRQYCDACRFQAG